MKAANYGPVYTAAMYPELAEISRAHGYALAVHGSLARDMDIICVPWRYDATEPQVVIEAFMARFAVRQVGQPLYELKEHGRLVTTLTVGFGECFMDVSFMPRLT